MGHKMLSAHTSKKTRRAIVRLTVTALLNGGLIALPMPPAPQQSSALWGFSPILPAQAVPARANLSLETYPNEGYQNLIKRAEVIAQTEVNDRFSRDVTISRISLVVMGHNGGLAASLLSLELDRTDWRRNPAISQYARYYPNARTLLDLPPAGLNVTTPTLGTGDIQVTLRWTGRDDLDLAVSEPGGEVVFFANPQLPSGATLDVDANALCEIVTPTPIEHVFWPTATATTGNYQVVVSLFGRCDASSTDPIPFTLTIATDGTPQTYHGEVSETDSYRSYRFDVDTP